MNKTTETMRAAESANLTRRYAAPLVVVSITFAVLVLGVLLLTTPNRVIGAFSARYLGLILTAVPYLIVSAGVATVVELYRPTLTTKLPRVMPVLVALAPVFSPVALFASVRAFPDRPEIVIGRVVAGFAGAAAFLVCTGGRTGRRGECDAVSAAAKPGDSNVIDTVARVLYDNVRLFLLGAFVFAVLHFVLQAPRPGAPPIPVTIAIPFALVIGVASGIPNAVLPLAALLVSDRIPPAATVVLLAAGAVIPIGGILATRSSRMRHVVAGALAAVVVVTVAIVWAGGAGSGGGV